MENEIVESPQANYPLSIFNSAFMPCHSRSARVYRRRARARPGERNSRRPLEFGDGALTELFAFKEPSPLVLFDRIPDHNPNFRVAANLINTPTVPG